MLLVDADCKLIRTCVVFEKTKMKKNTILTNVPRLRLGLHLHIRP